MSKEPKKNLKDSNGKLLEPESGQPVSSKTKPNMLESLSIKNSKNRPRPFHFKLYDVIELPANTVLGLPASKWLLDREDRIGSGHLVLRPLDTQGVPQRVSIQGLHNVNAKVVDHYNEDTVRILFGGK